MNMLTSLATEHLKERLSKKNPFNESDIASIRQLILEVCPSEPEIKARIRFTHLTSLISGHMEAMRPLLDEWANLRKQLYG